MPIVTLSERKARKTASKIAAAAKVKDVLRAYVDEKDQRGRFIVFGSAAAGTLRHDSDFDVIVDFPPDGEVRALHAVEDACREWDIAADVHSARMTSDEFLSKILSRPVEIIQ